MNERNSKYMYYKLIFWLLLTALQFSILMEKLHIFCEVDPGILKIMCSYIKLQSVKYYNLFLLQHKCMKIF
jgi:hypothetical protein